MFRKLSLALFIIAAASAATLAAGDDKQAPDWMQQAARASIPTYPKDTPAVVLYNEELVNVNSDGSVTTTTRYVVKCLLRGGRRYAMAGAGYLQSSSKVKDLKAWLIRPNGQVKAYGKDVTLEIGRAHV